MSDQKYNYTQGEQLDSSLVCKYYIRSSPFRMRPGLLPSCYGPGPLVNIYLPSGYP